MTASDRQSQGPSKANPYLETGWPAELASIGAIRFARTYYHYSEAVHFFRDLVGLPLYEQFEGSYGENGSIFGLPTSALTLEVVQGSKPIPASEYDALCLYFPDLEAQRAAMSRLTAGGVEPSESHPYWVATGGVSYRDPDGRQVVFAPFIYGKNEPPGSSSGRHSSPTA